MQSQLQQIVDDIAGRLQRSVAIDDAKFNLLVHSPQVGPVDELRLVSILERKAPAPTKAWVARLGIDDAVGPVRVAADAELGHLRRVCVPIRFQGTRLGYVWVIDEGDALTDGQLDELSAAVDRAAPLMFRARLLAQLERARERELLRDLLSTDAGIAEHAAHALVHEELLAGGARPVAVVVRPVMTSGATVADTERVTIDAALEAARGRVSPRHAVQLVRPDHGVLVVAGNDPALRGSGVLPLAEQLHDLVAARLDRAGRIVVGVGELGPDLGGAASSYRQALRATEVLQIVPGLGDVAEWGSLGIYRTLAQLPEEELERGALHEGLRRLVDDEANHGLVVTLETYLNSAGDAKATSDQLGIHRTSLYYRLGRIEELAGIDLKSGEDRLAMHIGIKVARLGGVWGAPHAARAAT